MAAKNTLSTKIIIMVEAIDSVVSSGSDSSGQFNEEVMEFLPDNH